MRRTLFLLFFVHLLTRLIYVNISGIFNNYNLQCDSLWLVNFADEVVKGNFNFDIGRFIASPLFPVVCGLFKIIFHEQWAFYLVFFQILLSSVSGLYIYRIAYILFKDKNLALFSSLIFAIFPMTIWYVHTFSQESIFQSLLIMSVYYLLASVKYTRVTDTVKAAFLFSLTYLTKSHILIFSLFIPLMYLHMHGLGRKAIHHTCIFSMIAFAFSTPYGMYQYKTNGSYIVSSNGAGYQFYLGNTEAGYKTIVDVPQAGTEDYERMKDITVHAGYFNGSVDHYNFIMQLPQKLKQKEFYKDAISWISLNPRKFIKMKVYDIAFFIIPGVSFRHYSFLNWISTFILCAPFYYFGYLFIFKCCRKKFAEHSCIFYLFISMLIFSTCWYVQNRFRTITLEPFYLIYASYYLYHALKHYSFGIYILNFLDTVFLKYLQSIRVRKTLLGY